MDAGTALLIVRIVGMASAVCAALGLASTLWTFYNFMYARPEEMPANAPYFRTAFVLFSALSVLFNILLAVMAVQLMRGTALFWWQFMAAFIPPLLYIGVIGAFWLHPRLGLSIAAATGIGNIGLAVPFLLLVPVWGPIALWYAL